MTRFAAFLQSLLDSGPFPGTLAMTYRLAISAFALIGTAVVLAGTVEGLTANYASLAVTAETSAILLLTLDLLLQASQAVLHRPCGRSLGKALHGYLTSLFGLIDLLAILPFFLNKVVALPDDWGTVLGVLRFLKLARYSPALETLGSVIRRESRPLRSALFMMTLLMLGTSTILYLVERHVNARFTSIPAAMWWSIATLTTVGYGDAVPLSPLGKLMGGITALLGIGMFALPASILATGFAEETRRRDFLATWRMVAKVPFFAELDAQQIADITALLKFYTAASGDVLIRAGDRGDRMYFIVSGVVAVELERPAPIRLQDGDFFGEIALLHNSPRTATVRALCRCQLLSLDLKDFSRFAAGNPEVADLLAQTAESRLRQQGLMDPVV